MALSISCCVLSCQFASRRLMAGRDCQHTVNFLRQLFHAERFGDVRQVVAFQKLVPETRAFARR